MKSEHVKAFVEQLLAFIEGKDCRILTEQDLELARRWEKEEARELAELAKWSTGVLLIAITTAPKGYDGPDIRLAAGAPPPLSECLARELDWRSPTSMQEYTVPISQSLGGLADAPLTADLDALRRELKPLPREEIVLGFSTMFALAEDLQQSKFTTTPTVGWQGEEIDVPETPEARDIRRKHFKAATSIDAKTKVDRAEPLHGHSQRDASSRFGRDQTTIREKLAVASKALDNMYSSCIRELDTPTSKELAKRFSSYIRDLYTPSKGP
jgi:hypothetical protein